VTSNVNDPNVDVFLVNSCTVKNPSESSFRSLVDSCKQQQKPVVVTGCVPQGDAKKGEGSALGFPSVFLTERHTKKQQLKRIGAT
jgi:tRNA A37 methylthiotransferase MiaB